MSTARHLMSHRLKQALGLIILLISLSSVQGQNEDPPVAHHGILNISDWDFEHDGKIKLTGEWEFYWDTLIAPTQFPSEISPEYHFFPHIWTDLPETEHNYSSFGYATYRLTIVMPHKSQKIMALHLHDFYTAYSLWLNDTLISQTGKVGRNDTESVPKWMTVTKPFAVNDDTLEFVLQISNFDHSKGGLAIAPELGIADELLHEQQTLLGADLLLTGALIMGGLFFMGLFLFGRKNKSILYFSLFCMVYSYRIIGTGEYYLHSIFPQLSWYLTIRLEYITLFLSPLLFMLFIQSVYPKETGKIPAMILKVVSLILVFISLFFAPVIFSALLKPYLVFLVFYILYGIWVFLLAAIHKREGSVFAIISIVFISLVFSMQILNYLGFMGAHPYLYFFGYVLFFFFQSLILSYRFAAFFKLATIKAKLGAKAKADFLATMSHEIRTPMNGVIGMTSLLRRTPLTEEQSEYVETIHTSSDNLLTIINDILDFSKIENGKLQIEEHPFDLLKVVQEVFSLFSNMAAQKDLQLILKKDESLYPFLIGDSNRLKQVLVNLMGNAIKFTDLGTITLSIRKEKEAADHLILMFSISDTGIGIPKEKFNLLFKSFSQIDSTSARQFDGTGLGLAISKQLVNLMGGDIWVESELNKGSTFSFTMRTKKAPKQASDKMLKDANEKLETLNSKNYDGFSVLIAEDNQINQKIAFNLLKAFGVKGDIAPNGKEALNACKIKLYDLVFMDIQMPEMDGIEATKAILDYYLRNHQKPPKIIAMTANVMGNVKEDCLNAGMVDFITKPFTMEQLKTALDQWLR